MADSPLYIEITDEPVIAGRSGRSAKTGEPYTIPPSQNIYLHGHGRYPLPSTISVPDKGPYRPGLYLLAGAAFKIGQYGLTFSDRDASLVALDQALSALRVVGPSAKASS